MAGKPTPLKYRKTNTILARSELLSGGPGRKGERKYMTDQELAAILWKEMQTKNEHQNILFLSRLLFAMKPEPRVLLESAFSGDADEILPLETIEAIHDELNM